MPVELTAEEKRLFAAKRAARAAKRQGLDVAQQPAVPPAALVQRDALDVVVGLSEQGLKLVERLARRGAPQSKIAASLGITLRRFKSLMDADESDVRLRWEKGRADHEDEIAKQLVKHGRRSFAALIYYSKAALGWKENDPATAVSVQSNIRLTLPRPMSTEDYFKMCGVSAPVDCRTPEQIALREAEVKARALPSPGQQ